MTMKSELAILWFWIVLALILLLVVSPGDVYVPYANY
mgnify:CR=1 FL=1